MKKFYTLSLMLMCALMAAAQFAAIPMGAPATEPATRADGDLTWLSYTSNIGKTPNNLLAVGTRKDGNELEVATVFPTGVLSQKGAVGKQITALAVMVTADVTTPSTIFLKQGTGAYSAMTTVASVEVPQLFFGWNYVKLETPYTIDANTPIAIGYKIKDNTLSPVAFDGKRSSAASSDLIIISGGQAETPDSSWGSPCIAALIGGDVNELAKFTIGTYPTDNYVDINAPVALPFTFLNTSFLDINSMTVVNTLNGVAEPEVEVTPEGGFAAHSQMDYNWEHAALTEKTEVEMAITKLNGTALATPITATFTILPYDASSAFKRTLLLERFTGQDCGYCPQGETTIESTLADYLDEMAVITNHYGYGTDMFTISGSATIGRFFGVPGAPMCMLDRAVQPARQDGSVVFNPIGMQAVYAQEAINVPTFILVNVHAKQTEGRTVKVTVYGKANLVSAAPDYSNARVTAAITLSGVKARQASGGSNYVHKDFPIVYLTAAMGDDLTLADDGSFSIEYTYEVPEEIKNGSFSKYSVDMTQLKAVAFVSNNGTKLTSEVYNAGTTKVLLPGDEGYNDEPGAIDTITGEQTDLPVEYYNLNGQRVYHAAPGTMVLRRQGTTVTKVIL